MALFVLSRFVRALVTVLLVVAVAFTVLRLAGDPADIILGPDAPQEVVDSFRESWGLDRAIYIQFLEYCRGLLRGDFGLSMRDGRPALTLLLERIPLTLAITVPALFVKILIGIPCGVYAALHQGTRFDRSLMAIAVLGFATPSFVLALTFVLIFSVSFELLPSGGRGTWQHAVLPIATLGLGGAAVLARFTRSAMLETLGRPYIRTASAKGLPWSSVVRSHALPNAAIPTVTLIGFLVGSLIAGAVVVESVFSWPGIGRLLVVAVSNRDLAVVQAILLFVAVTMVTSNLVVELLYGYLDPRHRK